MIAVMLNRWLLFLFIVLLVALIIWATPRVLQAMENTKKEWKRLEEEDREKERHATLVKANQESAREELAGVNRVQGEP